MHVAALVMRRPLALAAMVTKLPVGQGLSRREPVMIGRVGVLGACLIATGSAFAGEPAGDDDALSGFIETGETTNCVSMRSTGIEPVDENRLIFKVGGRYYLNETRGSCERGGASSYRLEAVLVRPQACRGDIFRVVDNQGGFQVGACNLGEFRVLKKKPKAAPEDETS